MELKEIILAILSKDWPFEGKSVDEVAIESKISKSSAFNYLKILEAEGRVVSRKVGKAWLYKLANEEGVSRVGYGAPSVKLMRKLLKDIEEMSEK